MKPDAHSHAESGNSRPGDAAPPADSARQAGAAPDDEPEPAESETESELAGLDPTDDEVEAWAARERERRRAWLAGPTDDERAAWARRERVRRITELGPAWRATDLARKGRHYGRGTMLATEGAANLMYRWSRRMFAELVRAGLEWEDEIRGRHADASASMTRSPEPHRSRRARVRPVRAALRPIRAIRAIRAMIILRQPRRLWQVLSVFALYFGGPRLGLGPYARLAGPVRLRLALARLGGAWVKFGQMLAMRLDLLPAAYCDELFRLLNQVEPFSYDDVRAIVSAELGDVPERIFQRFETESFAAASIGQVHRATLHSGEQVAVKVQRPGVRGTIRSDIEIMFSVSGLIDRMHLFGATRSRVVIEEFARWTADELDYLVEARQAALLHENAEGDRAERIARVYPDLTTSRVLTTELIEGIPLLDILRAVRDGDTAFLDALTEAGHDLDRIARHLDWNMLNQVYVFGVFHADLHPANLFVLPGDAIGYVDFGIVGQLSDRLRRSLTRYGWLLFRGDIEAAVGELMRWIAPSTASDVASARWRLERAHQAFVYETLALRPEAPQAPDPESRRGPVADNPYLRLASAVMDTVRDHELTVSGNVVAYLRMLVTLGTLRHQLAARYDVVRTARRFFRRMMRQEAISWLDPRLSLERLDAARTRFQRALDFVDFVEAQEQVITAGTASLFGVRDRVRAARQRLVRLGATTLIVGLALYFVLADRAGTSSLLPAGIPYEWAHAGLAVILVLLIVSLVMHLRQFGSTD